MEGGMEFGDGMPPGWIFLPTDEELIGYLEKRNNKQNLPLGDNVINSVSLYDQDIEQIIEEYKSSAYEGVWYFFTDRNRRCPKGTRPTRSTPKGFWRAIEGDTPITTADGEKIGIKKSLNFHRGTQMGEHFKSGWMMQEYIIEKFQIPKEEDTKLIDEAVLCKVYNIEGRKKVLRKMKGSPIHQEPLIQTCSRDPTTDTTTIPTSQQNQTCMIIPASAQTQIANQDPIQSQNPPFMLTYDNPDAYIDPQFNYRGGLIESNPCRFDMIQDEPCMHMPNWTYNAPNNYYGLSQPGLIDNRMMSTQHDIFQHYDQDIDINNSEYLDSIGAHSERFQQYQDTGIINYGGGLIESNPCYNNVLQYEPCTNMPNWTYNVPDNHYELSQPGLINNRTMMAQHDIFDGHDERFQQYDQDVDINNGVYFDSTFQQTRQ